MQKEFTHDVIAPVEGLHLTTDLVIYESVLFGSGHGYKPIPGVTDYYLEAYKAFGAIPFVRYREIATDDSLLKIDQETVATLERLPLGERIANAACIAFPISIPIHPRTFTGDSTTGLLEWLLKLGDQIVDLLRLFLYRPGDDRRIGRVGGLGRGVHGLWLISRHEDEGRFLARRSSPYALVADPVRLDLNQFRRWKNSDTFREFCTAACVHPDDQITLYDKIFAAMRSFRESREVQSIEGRFRHLMPLIEDLARRHDNEHNLKGPALRRRIAQVAWYSLRDDWDSELPLRWGKWKNIQALEEEVSRLWSSIRNPLSHTCRVITNMSEDPLRDLVTIEVLAVSLIRALGRACFESGATERDVYDLILNSKPTDLEDAVPMVLNPEFFQEMDEKTHLSSPLVDRRDQSASDAYGQTRSEAQRQGICVRCRSSRVTPSDFRDEPSKKEFSMSLLCQECQDSIFGKPSDNSDSETDESEEDIPF